MNQNYMDINVNNIRTQKRGRSEDEILWWLIFKKFLYYVLRNTNEYMVVCFYLTWYRFIFEQNDVNLINDQYCDIVLIVDLITVSDLQITLYSLLAYLCFNRCY